MAAAAAGGTQRAAETTGRRQRHSETVKVNIEIIVGGMDRTVEVEITLETKVKDFVEIAVREASTAMRRDFGRTWSEWHHSFLNGGLCGEEKSWETTRYTMGA